VFAVVGVTAVAFSTAAFAEDNGQVISGLATWKSAGCADCHGKFADGNPDDDDFPTGADLRTTRLDTAAIRQTIMCGRPGLPVRQRVLLLVGFGLTVLAAPIAGAQGLELPAGPDRDLVSRACQACHDLGMVLAATGMTRDGWSAAIDEMITYGMRVEPDERTRMLDYLSSRLGPSSAPAPK
jgi:hypothetical protein